jgi:uncharacterized protein (TIGR00730 family)
MNSKDDLHKTAPDPAIEADIKWERFFLEGPRSRTKELLNIFRIAWEFLRVFRVLHFVGPCVTVFGSARFNDGPDYETARAVGRRLAEEGFTVMTGGGPGLMEAANRGAREAGGPSVACAIELPMETDMNPYLDASVLVKYFFVRKVALVKYSYAFIVVPGGVGTMDEFFEALTLIQTGKILNFPVVVIGTKYWESLEKLMNDMADAGSIDRSDLDLAFFTDSVEEAVDYVKHHTVERFGVKGAGLKKLRLLGE